ncbi:MAG: hypothetical protein AB7O52_10180 [Planctomycetota bacterium]
MAETVQRDTMTRPPGAKPGGEVADLVRSIVREELANLAGTLDEKAGELFDAPNWRHEFNRRLEGAFQTVLPQLIKRFKAEIDERLQQAQASGSGGGELDFQKFANSDAMKEMLDDKFRHMLIYLRQDVIPKTIQKTLGK